MNMYGWVMFGLAFHDNVFASTVQARMPVLLLIVLLLFKLKLCEK